MVQKSSPAQQHQSSFLVPQYYRTSTLGQALQATLDDLISSHELTDETSDLIMTKFDQSILEEFCKIPAQSDFQLQSPTNSSSNSTAYFQQQKPAKLEARCLSYNNVDDVWKFNLQIHMLKHDSSGFMAKSQDCNLLALNAKTSNPFEPLASGTANNDETKSGRKIQGKKGRKK